MTGGSASVSLAEGTTDGEQWRLTATRQQDGLVLSLDGDGFGAGMGGPDPTPDGFQASRHAIGEGSVIEFGAVPTDVVRVEAFVAESTIQAQTGVLDPGRARRSSRCVRARRRSASRPGREVSGYDAAGDAVLHGSVGTNPDP